MKKVSLDVWVQKEKQWDELRKLDVDDRREAIRKKLRSNITGN